MGTIRSRNKCLYCNSIQTVITFANLSYCNKCGLIWQTEVDSKKSKKVYQPNYMASYMISPTYYPMLISRVFFVDAVKSMLLPYPGKESHSLLDVGCNHGGLLKLLATSNKYSPLAGVDINKDALAHLKGMKTYTDLLKVKTHYDIVTFFDSIEHFIDIKKALHHLSTVITPNIVIISTPNAAFKKKNIKDILTWHHYKPNEHLLYFNKNSLEELMKKFNYIMMGSTYIETMIRNAKIKEKNILTAVFIPKRNDKTGRKKTIL